MTIMEKKEQKIGLNFYGISLKLKRSKHQFFFAKISNKMFY